MKKVLAVFAALILALTLCLPAAAAGRGTTSGQMVPFLVDYDPQALSDILGGIDISGFFDDLGFGDIGGMLGDFDLGSLFGDFDIGSLLGDFDLDGLLGDFDIMGMIGDLVGCSCSGGGDTPAPTPTDPPTTNGDTDPDPSTPSVPKTSDNSGISLAIAFGVFSLATASVVLTRKRKTDEE